MALPLLLIGTQAQAVNNGLYAGIGLGLQSYLPKISVFEEDPSDINRLTLNKGKSGLSGHVLLGYSQPLNDKFSIAVQADGMFTGIKAQLQTSNFDKEDNELTTNVQSTKLKNSLGLSLRPAMNLNAQAKAFLIIGYRHSRTNEQLLSTETIGFSRNFSYNGVEYGVGTEVNMNPSLGLRLELSQTSNPSKSITDPVTNASFRSKFKANQAVLSLVYYPNWA